ncbi:YihY/virulence factor BrkB family protein [Rhodopila sp.]|uniref:YihY/virulence factor BrkB family protein n=1 Tax=Rhodopila sp. TaxID=2480087 RepID=UPI003D0AC676
MPSRLDKLKTDVTALTGREPSLAPISRGETASNRGRSAEHPGQIPAPGWKDVLLRSWKEISDNNIFLVSGGVTYAILLALFPGLAAMVSIYGLALDPTQVERQVASLSGLLPEQTQQMIADQLHRLVAASSGTLGISAAISLLVALWSASRGMSGLITALNIAYDQKETRSFFRFNLLAVGLTLMMLVGGLVVIALVAVLPVVIQFVGLGSVAKWLLLVLEWPLLFAVVITGLALLYRFAPNRDMAKWRWVSPGAIAATVLWIIGSLLFTLYVSHFASYDKTYGSLGGVVVMLTWLYLSAFVALFGAVVNAQSERQTQADSTAGQPKPMGSRQARAADTLGEAHN